MSRLTPDARAIVRALDALTAQVQRLADAATTTPDDAATTADDGPRCVCGDPIEQTGDPAYWIHTPGSDTPCTDARPPRGIPTPWWARGTRDQSIPEQAPAADEDAQRTARRKSLRVLLNRLNNGLPFTASEAQLLTSHVATLITEGGEARRRAEQAEELLRIAHETSNRSEAERAAAVQRSELAEAAIERVRALADRWDLDAPPPGNRPLTDLRAALDGTEQPSED